MNINALVYLDVPRNMSPSINVVIARAALILWADEHCQQLYTLLPETPMHSSCTIIDKWLVNKAVLSVTGHRFVLTERIKDPTCRNKVRRWFREGVRTKLLSLEAHHR